LSFAFCIHFAYVTGCSGTLTSAFSQVYYH